MINLKIFILRKLTILTLVLPGIQAAYADVLTSMVEDPMVSVIEQKEEGYVTERIRECGELVTTECTTLRAAVEAIVNEQNSKGAGCRLESSWQPEGIDGYCRWITTYENGEAVSKKLKPYCTLEFWSSCYRQPGRVLF